MGVSDLLNSRIPVVVVQMMSCMVNECSVTVLSDSGMQRLHLPNDDAIKWLDQTVMKALTR